MSDAIGGSASADLQFDSVVGGSAPAGASTPSATCAACERRIDAVYYDVNGVTACEGCRETAAALAETPRGAGPLLKAGVFGLGAGIVGAMIYYAVIALANLEIGIVAILIGYMVGYAVKRGAAGRGGRRFQILAVALTYASVAMAYTPLMFKGVAEAEKDKPSASASARPGTQGNADAPASDASRSTAPRSAGGFLVGLAILFGLIAALPVLSIVGSMPSGLISAFIIFVGMRQAWRMTASPTVTINGPYRVGGVMTSAPA